MGGRISPGPVFVYESLLAARRWQHYAGRALFVLMILVGLWIVWANSETQGNVAMATPTGQIVYAQNTSLQQLAKVGEGFFYTLAVVQLSIVMLAAPAATAGTICIDRARGTLLHMMVTDLSNTEIVLGKLFSRILPTLGLIAAALPVAAIGALLGGIDLEALMGLMVVSVGLALMGCTLAMAVALVATKVHEVLMAVYLIEGLSLLIYPLWRGFSSTAKVPSIPDVLAKLNPYLLAMAPYAWPRYVTWADYAVFAGFSLAISGALTLLCVLTLRKVVTTTPKPGKTLAFFRSPAWLIRCREWAGPTLDTNPIRWREWHRNRPSRFTRALWTILFTITWGLAVTGVVLYSYSAPGASIRQASDGFIEVGLMIQIVFGLLFFSAMSPTSLAEERMRGSLDVLISTPLSTREIVAGKWWGCVRMILPLMIMPVGVVAFYSVALPDIDPAMAGMRFGQPLIPLNLTDRLVAAPISLAQWISTGALIASLGIWLATRFHRVGRAVTAGVILYFVLGFGWALLCEAVVMPLIRTYGLNASGYSQTLSNALIAPSFLGPLISVSNVQNISFETREAMWMWTAGGAIFKAVVALLLFERTVRIFDRQLGRMPEDGSLIRRQRPGTAKPQEAHLLELA